MTYSKAVNKATKKWMKANREKITFVTEKGFNEQIKECADRVGMSKQAFIIEAIKTKMEEAK